MQTDFCFRDTFLSRCTIQTVRCSKKLHFFHSLSNCNFKIQCPDRKFESSQMIGRKTNRDIHVAAYIREEISTLKEHLCPISCHLAIFRALLVIFLLMLAVGVEQTWKNFHLEFPRGKKTASVNQILFSCLLSLLLGHSKILQWYFTKRSWVESGLKGMTI